MASIEQLNKPDIIKFIAEQQYFLNMCFELIAILSQFGYFLRVYELKKNYRYLTMKKKDHQKIIKQLSSCLIEKFNGFTIVPLEYDKKVRQKLEPVDIIYRPTKNIEIEPLCYLSTNIELAYSAFYTKNTKNIRSFKVDSCHYCNHFFVHNKRKFDRYMKHCTGKPGVVYDFNNQMLISYEDNFKSKGDLPFSIYFDFETTAPTDNCLDPEQKEMFVVFYVMIATFHPRLQLDRIIVNRSFAHSLEQLTTVNYLSREQLSFAESYILQMLKDYAVVVAKRKYQNSLARMFSIECAF